MMKSYQIPLDSPTATTLTSDQRKQIEKQLQEHDRAAPYELSVILDGDETPHASTSPRLGVTIAMHQHVLQPMSSQEIARHFWRNPDIVRHKRVLDMGCGSGLLGLVAGFCGAEHVGFVDVSEHAVANTRSNLKAFQAPFTAKVVHGDLFTHLGERFDLAVFAQPYFGGVPLPSWPVSTGMLDDGQLVRRFLLEAPQYVKGPIYMPFMPMAGPTNDPKVVGTEMGYSVNEVDLRHLLGGIQTGDFILYKLVND